MLSGVEVSAVAGRYNKPLPPPIPCSAAGGNLGRDGTIFRQDGRGERRRGSCVDIGIEWEFSWRKFDLKNVNADRARGDVRWIS